MELSELIDNFLKRLEDDGVDVVSIFTVRSKFLPKITQLEAELEMYERDETFGTLAIQLTQLEEENAALKREIQGLKAFLGGIKALLSERYQPTVIADRIDAILADAQESELCPHCGETPCLGDIRPDDL